MFSNSGRQSETTHADTGGTRRKGPAGRRALLRGDGVNHGAARPPHSPKLNPAEMGRDEQTAGGRAANKRSTCGNLGAWEKHFAHYLLHEGG